LRVGSRFVAPVSGSYFFRQTEHDTVMELRDEEGINDQALRRIQRHMELPHFVFLKRNLVTKTAG
jgi:hypothetical protein